MYTPWQDEYNKPGGGKITRKMEKKMEASKSSDLTLRRNARERERVRNINDAFESLRDRLPLNRHLGKKPSKYETLQAAIDYISQLRISLDEVISISPGSSPMGYMPHHGSIQSPESGFSSNSSSSAGDMIAPSPTKPIHDNLLTQYATITQHVPRPDINTPTYCTKIERIDPSFTSGQFYYQPPIVYGVNEK